MPCTLADTHVSSLGELYVPGGPPFAYAGTVPAAEVQISDTGRFAARLEGGGVTLDVEVASSIPVHLRRPGRFDGYLLVWPAADLLVEADGERIRASLPVVGESVGPTVFVATRPPTASLRCGELSIGPGASRPRKGPVDRLRSRGEDALLVRRKPGGEVVGTLPDGMFGVVDARRGDAVRATVDLGAGLAVDGWMQADTEPVDLGGGAGSIFPTNAPRFPVPDFALGCDAALQLAVEVDGAVVVVGSIAPGTAVVPTGPARDDGWSGIVLPGGWFSPWDGVTSALTGVTLLAPDSVRACPTVAWG